MSRKNGQYIINVEIRDINHNPVEKIHFSGKNAIVEAIYHLDTKYCTALDIIKRYW